ncbi:bifunctional hydroxymethylpyrimidine kinase/phosphomethylpyrimidine kinase [Enterococcus rivorum]|uniref:bifunctional hydroxymethylpyrimidine kinase/phosphomethylpyrimidine kinase n=1 Tax=Enterococcus rivorum TaxID=762845 RepID=UPI00363B80BF
MITPNIPEAEVISQMNIGTKEEMVLAAKKNPTFRSEKNVVVKGGHHLDGDNSSDVILLESGAIEWVSSKRINTKKNTHGTGCTFSACIAAELAKGMDVLTAVTTAKHFIQAAIEDGIQVGHGNGPTNHWAYRKVEQSERI